MLLLLATPALAQNRLDPPPATAPAPTVSTPRSPASMHDVLVFVTDEQVYGFAQPSPDLKRLGSTFHVYLVPRNASIQYRILIDEVPQRLGNNQTQRRIQDATMESLALPGLRTAKLQIEVQRGNQTQVLDYGSIRFRNQSDLAGDVKGNAIQHAIQQQLRIFTDSQFTWWTIRWGLVGLAAIALGLYGGFQMGREREEHEEIKTLGL
jgi:hypothetical protein